MQGRPTRLASLSPVMARKMVHTNTRRWGALCVSILTGVMLTGCAAQLAYRNGKELVAQDKVEAGLAKLQEAAERDPHNFEYRQAYLTTRERAAYNWLEQGDRLAAAGKRSQAEILYRRVLAMEPGSERARASLRTLERDQRHAQLLREGQAALDKKDVTTAREKLATILAENPTGEQSQALQHAIEEKTPMPTADTLLAGAYRKPITIEFKDAALKQVFEVIARSSGLNFLFDKDVKTDQKTSIFLKNSTIESAVHFTLLTNQLEQQVLDANTILIYPNTAAKLKDYQEMVIKSFFLTNADAKAVANTLKTIIKSRDIVIDEKLNMLIVRDSPDAIKLAEKLVALQDVAEPEVMLEVEILEVKRSRLLELGIQWPSSMSLTPLSLAGTGSASSSALTLFDLRNQSSRTLAAGISPVTVHAKKEDSDANLLANPRIRARNHEKAKILIGDRVPNITTTATSTGFVSESISYIDVGLKLDVEPTIYLDNEVAIKISMEVSNIVSQLKTASGSVAYQIGTRTASTVLRLKDGENQVLAGLINDEDRRTGNKVPGLGELPIVGRLFGSSADDNVKTEIVLSITPHLIRNIQRPGASQSEFRSGTDSSFRSRPDAFGTLVAPGLPMTPASPNGSAGGVVGGPNTPAAIPNTANPPGAGGTTPAAAMVGGAQLSWQGPTQLKVGDTATLQLMMRADQPITSVPMTVGFDSRVLQVVGITEGTFLKQGGAQTNFTSRVDPNGQVLITAARAGNGGATSLGEVATLNFRALAPGGASAIQLLTATPLGLEGRPVVTASPSPFTIQVSP
jgi:general secretion pathway protein D